MRGDAHHLLDHCTDVAGIVALTVLASKGTVEPEIVASITSIAIGQRYAKAKWGDAYSDT